MRSFPRALTGTVLTAGLVALAGGAAAAEETYTVRSGDTLASIASSHDEVSTWRQLAEANADVVSDPNVIHIGQVLAITGSPPPTQSEPETHTVEPGETLSIIADGYASVASWRQLAEYNTDVVSDPNVIHIGQVLALTGSATPEPAPEPETSSEPESSSEPASEPEPVALSEPAPSSSGNVSTATWDRVAECESNGNWSINTGNGYYGGLQFAKSSWDWVGGSGMPHHASKAEQIARAEILLERQGWGAWPACSQKLGLR